MITPKNSLLNRVSAFISALTKFIWTIIVVLVLAAVGWRFLLKEDLRFELPTRIEKKVPSSAIGRM